MTEFFIELDKNMEIICKMMMISLLMIAIILGTIFYIKIIFFSKEDKEDDWSTAYDVKLGDIIYPRWSSNFFTEGKRYIVKNIYLDPSSTKAAYIIAKNDLEEEQECSAEYFYILKLEKNK